MLRPTFTSRLSLPQRLKHSSNTTNGTNSTPTTVSQSRNGSPKRAMAEQPKPGLVLRANVIKGRNLAAKDRSGKSDPYLVLSLGDAKEATPTINKTLNPEWNTVLELPVTGEQSLLLEVGCWDKDRFGKDYMGEFDVILEDQFLNGQTVQEPQWFPLQSRRTGKKKSVVSGEIQIQFSLIDATNLAAPPEQTLQKFLAIAGQTPSPDEDEEMLLLRGDSNVTDNEEEEESSDEAQDESKKAEKREKQRKRLRLARLKKKAKQMSGYEYSSGGDVAGVLFLEIQKITDLPPERNVTRTSFDMDPFVVTSLGKKTYRTRTINHNLNPVYEEKLVFQVMRHEVNYSVSFTVVDKDKFSGNDYVGTVNLSLDKAVSVAPQADPESGLYKLPEPSDSPGIQSEARRSRFRLPMSRSSSSHSLSRLGRPSLKKENSSSSLSIVESTGSLPPAPTSAPQDTQGNLAPGGAVNINPSAVDDEDLKSYTLPLEMKNKDRWEDKHNPTLHIRAKYVPYKALRQQFWRAMLKQYDADDSGLLDKVELTTMLDTLGSTLHESTIDGFFERFASQHNGDQLLTFDEAVVCLEDQLQATEQQDRKKFGSSGLLTPGAETPSLASGSLTPINQNASTVSIPALETDVLGKNGEEGDHLHQIDDLSDDKGEEHVIEIRECPICHQPKLNKRSDANIITHIATCASQDWRQVNNIVMAGFVTSSQAQRKWYSKVITKISYGGYKLGANSANILVQDRITGQINEERMSVYVRLGIRLLYKGLKANNMEKKRIRKLLKSLSFKQGKKYDDPASAAEIAPFIAFHQLNMNEVLLPTEQFKNFNEFFYRALKPDARPCSAPEDPRVIVSPADCRSVVFNTIDSAQAIWVKGREFTVERLLGEAYPEDAKRYHGGSLGIFRLAPQDYHRFHIPVDGVLDEPKLIEGEYYTVNPMAIRSALDVYGENIRVVCPIDSVTHGRVMVICIGAMMVGSTIITRKKGEHVKRAEELGYFKFGGSTLLVLFEPGQMKYDDDLVDNSKSALETLVRVGMSIGHSPNRAPHMPDLPKDNPTMEEKQDAKRRIEGSLAPQGQTGPVPGAGF